MSIADCISISQKPKNNIRLLNYKLKMQFQSFFVAKAIFIVGKVFELFSKWDKEIQKEISNWDESFSVMFKVLQDGPSVELEKKQGRLQLKQSDEKEADLIIYFKNIHSAFLIFTLQITLEQGVAEHRISTKGDIANAMSIIRCFSRLLSFVPLKK